MKPTEVNKEQLDGAQWDKVLLDVMTRIQALRQASKEMPDTDECNTIRNEGITPCLGLLGRFCVSVKITRKNDKDGITDTIQIDPEFLDMDKLLHDAAMQAIRAKEALKAGATRSTVIAMLDGGSTPTCERN